MTDAGNRPRFWWSPTEGLIRGGSPDTVPLDYPGAVELVPRTEVSAAQPDHCPRCDSPDPRKHPAVQFEGEVQVCPHPWHSPAAQPDEEARPVALPDDIRAQADRIAEECYVVWRNTPNRDAYIGAVLRDASRRAALAALRGQQQ